MRTKYQISSRFSVLLIVVCVGLAIGFCGCSSISTFGNKSVPVDEQSQASRETYRVEMSGGLHKSSVYDGTLDGPITVQTALERSGAVRKYRNMEVSILRVVEDTGRGLKMSIEYQPGKNSVKPEQDYAIFPNDRIIVEASSNSTFTKLVDQFGGGE